MTDQQPAPDSAFTRGLEALAVAPVGAAVEMDLPRQSVLAIDGEGHPGSPMFRQGVRDLWRAAYAVQGGAPRGPARQRLRDATDRGRLRHVRAARCVADVLPAA